MRGPALGRLAAGVLVVLAALLAAVAVGVALVLVLGSEAPPGHARPEPPEETPGTLAASGLIVLADLPTPTRTATRPPLPTATVLVPSATHTTSPTPPATSTPSPPPTATVTPRPTSTPILPRLTATPPPAPTPLHFAAPQLIAPEDGAVFAADDTVELAWSSVGALPPGIYYVITLAYPHGGATWYDETPWTQDTAWRMSEHLYLLDLADGGRFRWTVQVRRHVGTGADGRPTGEALGPESEMRTLTWSRSSGGGGGGRRNTPEPPRP